MHLLSTQVMSKKRKEQLQYTINDGRLIDSLLLSSKFISRSSQTYSQYEQNFLLPFIGVLVFEEHLHICMLVRMLNNNNESM